MEWLFGLAILPVLLCGLMCAVPMVLAAVGFRRTAARRECCDEPNSPIGPDNEPVIVER